MRVLIVTFVIVISDQLAKLFVKGVSLPALGISLTGVPYGSSRPLLGNFLRLTYIENPGMAFGIDIGGKLFFSLFSIVASAAIVAYMYHARRESFGFRLSLAMILGGALGNLIDRVFYGVAFGDAPLFYGKVVDFLDMNFFDINIFGYQLTRWPVFNIADASVTLGVLLLLFFHRSAGVVERAAAGPPYVPGPAEEAAGRGSQTQK
ncbi:MAG TPA: signal peptidase II [Bacteroidota bacterium]|nr:signal peptidase II [Bacteroidota bacterium]